MHSSFLKRKRFLSLGLLFLVGSYFLSGSLCSCRGRNMEDNGSTPSTGWGKKHVPGTPKKDEAVQADPSDDIAMEETLNENRRSPFGLDYVFILNPKFRRPEIARDFGKVVAVRWVNFTRIQWDQIEPNPPIDGKHIYRWVDLDEGVRQWQQYGVHIMMTVNPKSGWGTAPFEEQAFDYIEGPLKRLALKPFKWYLHKTTTDNLPKAEHMGDYRSFIYSLVERYDGDGTDDMPGLRSPILHYQVGNEYCNEIFWGSSVENYGILLKEAFKSARKANGGARIILSGISFDRAFGLYDSEVDPRTRAFVEKHAGRYKEDSPVRRGLNRANDFSMKSMTFCDSYDIVDTRGSFYGRVLACKDLLHQFGCPGKEIWSAEVFALYPLLGGGQTLTGVISHPYPMPSKSIEYRKILKRPKNKEFNEINAWYRGIQAAQLVKVCTAALHAGSRKVMVGNALDMQSGRVIGLLGALAYSGLRSETFEKLWPAAYTYKVLIQKLDGIRSCRRLAMPEHVYVYEFVVKNGKRVLVAFYDDHIGQNHDEPFGVTQVEIPFSGTDARVTHVIKEIDKKDPLVERVEVKKGKLVLPLSEYPVFIESLEEQ